jgi:transposase
MQNAAATLPSDTQELQQTVLSLQAELALKDDQLQAQEAKIQYLLEQFRLAQQRRFGQSRESVDQLGLFDEAEGLEAESTTKVEADTEQATVYQRNKPKRQPLPKDLPREQIVHDIDEADKVCGCCGHGLHRMGEETAEQLEFIPASIKVMEHIRPKYSCRHCEQQGTETPIKMAAVPAQPIPKGIATASLLAQVITSKYQYALPLHRQEVMFQQYGIGLSRKTMADWMIQCSTLLQPIYQALKATQLQQPVIHADETPLKVIHEDKSRCYMWVYCTGTDSPQTQGAPPPNIVLYDYRNSRSGQCPVDYLQGYGGYLQVDGYAGYGQTGATLVGCWAHARRKFMEAKQTQPKGTVGKADWAMGQTSKLYRIEAQIKDMAAVEKQQQRQQQALPLLEQLKDWLDKSSLQVTPKSALGGAIAYTLKQWPKLVRYIEHGQLSIDNNRAERAIKPFVVGRKNWLFSNTSRGAQASATLYSLVETAKANGLTPFGYIKRLLEELPTQPDDLQYLMPWNIKQAD